MPMRNYIIKFYTVTNYISQNRHVLKKKKRLIKYFFVDSSKQNASRTLYPCMIQKTGDTGEAKYFHEFHLSVHSPQKSLYSSVAAMQ